MKRITEQTIASKAGNPPSLCYSGPHTLQLGVLCGATLTEDCSVTSARVTPPLPAGLTLKKRHFIGTPTALSPLTTYTFTVTNRHGSSTLTAQVEVLRGPLLGAKPAGRSLVERRGMMNRGLAALVFLVSIGACSGGRSTPGSNATAAPPPDSTGSNANSDPTTLYYYGPHSLEIGVPVSGLIESSRGADSLSISPALSGIVASTDGSFDGSATVKSAPATYTFTVGYSGRTSSIAVQLEVVGGPIFYPSPPTAIVGIAMTPLVPRLEETFEHFKVTPGLPPGLILDSVSGVISGTPQQVSGIQNYEITASGPLSDMTFGILLGVSSSAAIPASTGNNSYCAYSGGFIGTYQGELSDDGYGLVAIAFTPDGIGSAHVDDLATNTAITGVGAIPINLADGAFDISLSGENSASIAGKFLGADRVEGNFTEGGITRHFAATRLGGAPNASRRFTGGFSLVNGTYPTGFAVFDEDANGNLNAFKYQFGTGFNELQFAHVTPFTGSFTDKPTIYLDKQTYVGRYNAADSSFQVGDPYDIALGPFENGSSFFSAKGCQLN